MRSQLLVTFDYDSENYDVCGSGCPFIKRKNNSCGLFWSRLDKKNERQYFRCPECIKAHEKRDELVRKLNESKQ